MATKLDLNIQELIQKYQETKSVEKVSNHFGVSRHTISKLLKSNNVEIVGNSKRLNELEVIQKYQELKSTYKVADIYNVNSSTILNILEKNGIERRSNGNKSHGKKYSKTYMAWSSIKQRCKNVNSRNYKYYGGRGIKVCERWYNFQNFLEDMGECPDGYRLERLDASKDYFKENCKWELKTKSFLNKRDTLTLEIDGVTKPLLIWYNEKYIHYTYANFVNIFHNSKQLLIHLIKNADNRHS